MLVFRPRSFRSFKGIEKIWYIRLFGGHFINRLPGPKIGIHILISRFLYSIFIANVKVKRGYLKNICIYLKDSFNYFHRTVDVDFLFSGLSEENRRGPILKI